MFSKRRVNDDLVLLVHFNKAYPDDGRGLMEGSMQ